LQQALLLRAYRAPRKSKPKKQPPAQSIEFARQTTFLAICAAAVLTTVKKSEVKKR